MRKSASGNRRPEAATTVPRPRSGRGGDHPRSGWWGEGKSAARFRGGLLVVAAVLVGAVLLWNREPPQSAAPTAVPATTTSAQHERGAALPAFLPREAHTTLDLIARDGPFPHRQDGAVFGNRERLLPAKPRGYYHEYTVRTPGLDHRGARRIVTGGTPPIVYYYTDDHYRSFRRFEVRP